MALKQKLKLIEGDDPLVRVLVTERKTDGTVGPFDLTNATISFLSKPRQSSPDSEAIISYSSEGTTPNIIKPTATSTTTNECFIQFAGADLVPGTFFYRIKVVRDNRTKTVSYGPLEIENV